MQELKDIKPFIDNIEWQYYIFYIICLILIVLLLMLFYQLFMVLRNYKKENNRKTYIKLLKSLDKNNPKDFAYKVTKYGRFLANDKRSKEIFSQLEDRLYKYKYKKNVLPLDDDTIMYYRLFVEVVDV